MNHTKRVQSAAAVIVSILLSCTVSLAAAGGSADGPQNSIPELDGIGVIIYVDAGAVEGNGEKNTPWPTIAEALEHAGQGNAALLLAGGEYLETGLVVPDGVHIYGGYNPDNWERDINSWVTLISPEEQGRIFTLGSGVMLDGVTVSGGTLRGEGAAVLCNGTDPVISNSIFRSNKTLGPENWNPEYWHENAYDGGAVYGKNGAAPEIRNCVFINNKTENGRGAAVALEHNSSAVIEHSIFIHNVTGLDDPMRSSDGGAVSIFDWCTATIRNNYFISNYAGASNDAGALFIALWSSAVVENNVFVDNECGDDAGALFVGGQEHRYDAPLDPIPPKDKFFVSIRGNTFLGNRNSSMNSGAMRFTMESRGEFVGNMTALNNGIYFQRSEFLAADNIILDDMLVIETKEGLEPGVIRDNVIWAAFTKDDVPVTVENNTMLHPAGAGNRSVTPAFADNSLIVNVAATNYDPKKGLTTLTAMSALPDADLRGRVVRNNELWGVVASAKGRTIKVWGKLPAISFLYLLPTYELEN